MNQSTDNELENLIKKYLASNDGADEWWGYDTVVDVESFITALRQREERLCNEARIDELRKLMPPEQYKDYAKIAGQEHCVVCGFNSEQFRRHLDDRIKSLTSKEPNHE